jgi:phage minor structural protein
MDFYFTDRSFNYLGTANAGGKSGDFFITDDEDHEYASTAVGRTYSGNLRWFDDDLATKAKTMAALGNFLLYKDEKGDYLFMTIAEWTSADISNGSIQFVAENGGIDLINETVNAYTASGPMTAAQYIEYFTTDSGFEIGVNEIPSLARTLSWDGDDDTALTRIESVATQFDNAELKFRFDVTGTRVISRYIDIYKHIGADKGQRLEVNTHLNSITVTGNIYDLYTSITGKGAAPEGKETPVTLEGYKYTDPDGRYVLSGRTLKDTVANQKWSRFIDPNLATKGGYVNRDISYEATTQATLFQSMLADLKKAVEPVYNYDVDIVELPSGVEIGDTIHVVDEVQRLNLSTRLLELVTSYADGTHTATLGDYMIEQSEIDPQLQKLAADLEAVKSQSKFYPWVRYADDDQGTNMSVLPAGKTYMATVYGATAVPSDDPSAYAGMWIKVRGATGAPGDPGKDGKSSYTHIAYAQSSDGKTGFSTTNAVDATYIGQYVDDSPDDSTDPAKYTWALFQGPKGDRGDPGKNATEVTTFSSGTSLPDKVPIANSRFWLTDDKGVAIKFYTSDGTNWVEQQISASNIAAPTFDGLTFNGVTFNGSKFVSSFSEVQPEGATFAVHGTSTLESGALSTIAYSDTDNSLYSTTSLTPLGLDSISYYGGVKFDTISIKNGQMMLGGLYKKSASDAPVWESGTLTPAQLLAMMRSGLLAWQGTIYPQAGDVATMSVNLDQTFSGWLVEWQYFNSGRQDSHYNYTLVPNIWTTYHASRDLMAQLSMPGIGTFFKQLIVTNTQITGVAANNSGTQSPKAVMSRVFAV